jgi:hypothetical protein
MVPYPKAIPKTNAATIVANSRNESISAVMNSFFLYLRNPGAPGLLTLSIGGGALALESAAPTLPSIVMQLYIALTAFDIGK